MTTSGIRNDTADLVIRAGMVVDGTGSAPFGADVRVSGGVIVAVERDTTTRDARVIDGSGLVVAPGLIDVHTHADLAPFLGQDQEAIRLAGVRQGVTTVIAGNCGFSVFPTFKEQTTALVRDHLATLFGETTRVFADLADYADALGSARLESNIGALIGQGTLRAAVVGFADRPATAAEIEHMRSLLAVALEQGALGLSSGLLYPPGSYAGADEIVTLAETVAGADKPYVIHIRNEMDLVEDALAEAIEIGRRTGVRVQVSHLKAAGRANHGRLRQLLAMLAEAHDQGVDIGADAYPYEAGSTVLHALLPPWATEDGVDQTLKRLSDPTVRDRVRSDFANPPAGWQNFIAGGSWDDVTIASAPAAPDLEGVAVGELARRRGEDPVDTVADLLITQRGSLTVIVEMTDKDDVVACLGSPLVMIGSDGIPVPGKPHPRWAGSFARVLSREWRQRAGLSLTETVRKMTSYPADRFKLTGRGVIRAGACADLVVFDEGSIEDGATYGAPLTPPRGIHHVIVNGHLAVEDGLDTGVHAGKLLEVRQRHHL